MACSSFNWCLLRNIIFNTSINFFFMSKLNAYGREMAQRMIRDIDRMKGRPQSYGFVWAQWLEGTSRDDLPEYMSALPDELNRILAPVVRQILIDELKK